MRIRTKVILGLVVVGGIFLAGALLMMKGYEEQIASHQLHGEIQRDLYGLRDLELSLQQLLQEAYQYAVYGAPWDKEGFLRSHQKIASELGLVKDALLEAGAQEQGLAMETHGQRVLGVSEEMFAIQGPVGNPETASLMRELDSAVLGVSDVLTALSRELDSRREQAKERSSRIRNRLLASVIIGSFFMILGGVLVGVYFSRVVTQPVRLLVKQARRISQGDFSQRLDAKRKDEFGTLNQTLNFILDELKEREKALVQENQEKRTAIEELEAANEKLQLSNEELESANEELQIANEEMESSNEELNVSNQELETSTRELSATRELLEQKNQELKNARDYLETIFQNTRSGICVLNRDYTIESANRALREMMGYGESELAGSRCYEVFHGLSNVCPGCPVEETFLRGTVNRYNHRHLCRDGKELILDITATPLLGNGNGTERVIETITNITEVTMVTKELDEQKKRMSSILFNMGEGVCVISGNHEIEFINAPLRMRFGEIVGQKCYQAFRGFDRPCPGEPCSLDQVVHKGKQRFEVTKRNEDGCYYRMTSVPLVNSDSSLSMIQIRQDITAQTEFEEERKRYTEQLEHLNLQMEREVEKRTLELRDTNAELRLVNDRLREMHREKSELIDIAVHDLRTPLTSILSYAEILRKYQEEPLETRTEFLDIVINESYRMRDLINDYLDLSKLEAGFVEFQQDDVDAEALIQEILPAFESRIRAKKIQLTSDLPHVMPSLTADRKRIKQVFVNLIDNAVKYSPQGSRIQIHGEVREEQGEVLFTVRDSGPGIDEKDHPKLFNKFERIMDREVRKFQGSGLGLSIVKTIVEHYGGRVWVESAKGNGSCFLFALPVEPHVLRSQHVVSMTPDTSKLIRQMGPLWVDHLNRNYMCAYFASPADIDRMKETLSEQNLDIYDLMDREQIVFSPARDALLNQGKCDGEHLFKRASSFCDRVMRSRWEGLVIARDMSRFMLDEKAKQEVLFFEKKMDHYLRKCKKPVVLICQYHPDHFSEVERCHVAKGHPYRLEMGRIVVDSHS